MSYRNYTANYTNITASIPMLGNAFTASIYLCWNIQARYDMNHDISIDDPTRDDTIIFQNFMKELCRRDDEANRNPNVEDGNANIFSVEETCQQVLNAFALESVLPVLREHILENRDNEPLELLDNETSVRLTNAGRIHYGEYGV